MKLAAGFGGGMAGTGQTCGAVTGAVMVIGMALGHTTANDRDRKARTYTAVARFMHAFEQSHGTVNCTELLVHDLGDPEGYRQAKKSGLFTTACPKFVESAAMILERVLDQDGQDAT